MAEPTYFIPRKWRPPPGFEVLDGYVRVKGAYFHYEDAIEFINRSDGWLQLQADPGNVHDKNAIKVLACYKGMLFTKRRLIGYVPSEIAAGIAISGLLPELRLQLTQTHDQGNEHVKVVFKLIGPAQDVIEAVKRIRRTRRAKRAAAQSQ